MKKGQITIEFLLGLIAILSLFTITIQIYVTKNAQLQDVQEFYDSKHSALELARHLNAVFLAGDGAEEEFYLPKVTDANVSVSSGKVQIISRSQTAEVEIIAQSLSIPSAISTGSQIHVENLENTLVITNA